MIHTDTLSCFPLLYLCLSTGEVWERCDSAASHSIAIREHHAPLQFGSVAVREHRAPPRAGAVWGTPSWVYAEQREQWGSLGGPNPPRSAGVCSAGRGVPGPPALPGRGKGSFPSAPWFFVCLA